MKKRILNFLIVSTILFSSCVSSKTFMKNDQIPEDFGKGNKAILIIPSGYEKIDRAVEAAFEAYYTGDYELGGGVKSNKKSVAKIGYTFNTYTSFNPGRFTASGREGPSADTYFGVTDLDTKKTYKNIRYGNYKKFARLFVQALEIVRKQNQ